MTNDPAIEPSTASPEAMQPTRPRPIAYYPWLEGMRGIAALYVMLHHAAAEVHGDEVPTWLLRATAWLDYGHLSVAVFIVLSGFSLMLPVVRDGQISGGLRGYFTRRARRIMPAYYAALLLILLLILLCPPLRTTNGNGRWDLALPALGAQAVFSHIFLLHDMRGSWIYKIDPPMWSIAVEWHIYFLFPLLVFAWRKWGHAASLTLAFATTLGVLAVFDDYHSLVSCPWYIALFAVGMLAAAPDDRLTARFSLWSWPLWLFVVGATGYLIWSSSYVRIDIIVGMITAGTLTYLARADRSRQRFARWTDGLLGCKPVIFLGKISFSLYLVHFPILSLFSNLMLAQGVGPVTRMATLLFVGCPVALALSYPFHLAFERPYLVKRRPQMTFTSAAGT